MGKSKENYLMLWITTFVVGLSGLIYIAHHVFGLFQTYTALLGIRTPTGNLQLIYIGLVAVTIGLLLSSWVLFKKNATHPKLRLLLTLTLTHGSMLIIAFGNGLLEYHFSIFMVLAFITYFHSISLIVISTAIFAVHHLAGYFLFPELLCGTSDYRFSLLLLHAIFLLLTSGANIILTLFNSRTKRAAEAMQEQSEQSFKLIVEELTKTVEHLMDVTENIEIGANESRIASSEIATSIYQLKEGSATQSQQADENTARLLTVSQTMSALHTLTTNAREATLEATASAEEGERLIEHTTTQFETFYENTVDLEKMFQNFIHQIDEIEQFVNDITNIANQTNLLALNASIEAARAGEAGQGFSVVANEVRKLAHQSESSAQNVSQVVSDITNTSAVIVGDVSANVRTVRKGMDDLQMTNDAFMGIRHMTISIEQQMFEVASMVKEIYAESEPISESMNQLKMISSEGLAGSEQISAAAEEQLASIESLNESAHYLQELTEDVGRLIVQIKHS